MLALGTGTLVLATLAFSFPSLFTLSTTIIVDIILLGLENSWTEILLFVLMMGIVPMTNIVMGGEHSSVESLDTIGGNDHC